MDETILVDGMAAPFFLGTWKLHLEDPMIPFDLEESSKRMYLHLRRKENRWKKLYSGPLG